MIAPNWLLHPVCHAIASWQESGENPVVFCYLMVWGYFVSLRSPKFAMATERFEPDCWNHSANCCTRSTVLMDSDS
jgi:hypothetical protein